MMSPTATRSPSSSVRQVAAIELLLVAEHAIDFGHGGERVRLGLRRAAGDDDARLRLLAAELADRLARLPHRFGGDRAGVDHDRVGRRRPTAPRARITSNSKALSRQPKVTTSTLMRIAPPALRKQRRIEAALELEFDRAGHQHVVVALAPFDREVAARQRDAHLAPGPPEPRGRDRRGAGGRAAGLGQAGAALPGADDDVLGRLSPRTA